MVFDPTKLDINLSKFLIDDFSSTAYGEFKDELPPNTPQERGVGMTMRDFLISDHADDTKTRSSRNGLIIFFNNVSIY